MGFDVVHVKVPGGPGLGAEHMVGMVEELIEDGGHFPWIERKGVARDLIASALGAD